MAQPVELAAILPLLEWSPAIEQAILQLPQETVDRVVGDLSADQLADLAVAVDLTPLRPILESIDDQAVAEAARVVFARREYAALARLAVAIPPRLLPVAIAVAEPADLEAVLPLLEPSAELDEAIGHLPDDQWASLVEIHGAEALPVKRA